MANSRVIPVNSCKLKKVFVRIGFGILAIVAIAFLPYCVRKYVFFGFDPVYTVQCPYEYPDDWQNYPVSEAKDMLEIDPGIVKDMATMPLVETVLAYPFLSDMYAYSDPVGGKGVLAGVEAVASRFGALDELLSRQDAEKCLKSAVRARALARFLSHNVFEEYMNAKMLLDYVRSCSTV